MMFDEAVSWQGGKASLTLPLLSLINTFQVPMRKRLRNLGLRSEMTIYHCEVLRSREVALDGFWSVIELLYGLSLVLDLFSIGRVTISQTWVLLT